MSNTYDPWDIYGFEESERLKEVRNASHKIRPKGDAVNEKNVQGPQEGERGLLFVDKQKEEGIKQVAPKGIASYKGRGRRWGRK